METKRFYRVWVAGMVDMGVFFGDEDTVLDAARTIFIDITDAEPESLSVEEVEEAEHDDVIFA